MLAPLLAGMSLPDPTLRLTAEQALEFYREHRAKLTTEQLNTPVPPMEGQRKSKYYLNPWRGLSAEFVAQWPQYHAHPPSLLTRLLRYVCQWHQTWIIVFKTRQNINWVGLFLSKSRQTVRPFSRSPGIDI